MKAIILITTFTTALAPSLLALTPVSDTFSAATLNGSLWQTFRGETGKVVQSGGRVHYTASLVRDNYAGLVLLNNNPGYNESWQVTMDVTNTAAQGDWVGVGITISNTADQNDNVNFEFYGKGGGGGFNFYGITNDRDDESLDIQTNPQVSNGSMRITFNGNTKLFTFWYDRTGSADGYQWSRLGSFSINGVGGDRRGNWRMTNTNGRFFVNIQCYSENRTVAKGKVSFDNFRLKAYK